MECCHIHIYIRGQPLRPDSSDVDRASISLFMLGSNASYASSVIYAMSHTYVYILRSLLYNHACGIMPDLLWTVIQ